MRSILSIVFVIWASASAFAGEFHQHPDGGIYVRSNGQVYSDTAENFLRDFPGAKIPALPSGANEQIYTQGKRHAFMGDGNVMEGGPMPWPDGDAIIGKIQQGIASQNSRRDNKE